MIKICYGIVYFAEQYRHAFYQLTQCFDSIEQIDLSIMKADLDAQKLHQITDSNQYLDYLIFFERMDNQFVETFDIWTKDCVFEKLATFLKQHETKKPEPLKECI